MGKDRLNRIKEKFENALGEKVRLQGERLDDIGAHLLSKAPSYDNRLVPPKLVENCSKVAVSTSRVSTAVAKVMPQTEIWR